MRTLFLVLVLIATNIWGQSSTGDFLLSKELEKEIDDKSGSAFVQFSGFQPSSFKEILISVSGNTYADSILLIAKTDTLITNGAKFFDEIIRKDYALGSIFSPTSILFSRVGLYDEVAIKRTIVRFYQRYLQKENSNIYRIKRECLKGRRSKNKRAKRIFKSQQRKMMRPLGYSSFNAR